MKFKSLILVLISNVLLVAYSTKVWAQQKLAYVDSEELLMGLSEMKVAEQTFQTIQKQKQAELEKMHTGLSLKIADYEAKYKTLSEANKDVLEKELKGLVSEIENLQKRLDETSLKYQQELPAQQEKLYAPILQKAQGAIKQLAKEKGYAYVLDISQPGVLYFSGDDLTPELTQRLQIITTVKK